MTGLIELAKKWRAIIVREKCGTKRFGLSKDPSGRLGYPQPNMVRIFFREWEVIKERRKLALDEEGRRKEDFDIYRDSWFDYPMVIKSKMRGSSWEQYKRFIAIHSAACTLSCWHCYVAEESKNPEWGLRENLIEYVTTDQIIDAFFEQRDTDEKRGKLPANVLRITGGEPFLMPDLILQILEKLSERGKTEEIFIWTETNLTPFLRKKGSDQPLLEKERWVDLDELAKFKNLAIHPCLHGICPSNFHWITGHDPYYFNGLLDGLKILIEHGLDIYPTFGSNVAPSEMVPYIFKRLMEIDEKLPLRFALIDYELCYPPTWSRIVRSSRPKKIYNKILVIRKWDELLKQAYGSDYGYAKKHRHLIPLGERKVG